MKTLHLLRHAKSAWDQPQLPDRERGLNKRGRRDAPRMGEALSTLLPPMAVAVSPARRAQLTLEGLCRGWPALGQCRHCTHEALYTFEGEALLDWIRRWDDDCESLFVIGHNPALFDVVETLAGAGSLAKLPTAGYVCLQSAAQRWGKLQAGGARLVRHLFPKELG